ncbi:MAG: aldehyde dehydrogenase family protein [Candidatus Woesearchaeota archaeon]
MISKKEVKTICNKLLKNIESNYDVLKKENKKITNDSDYWIDYDYNFIIKYLNNLVNELDFSLNAKPKGKILIILSYNEPFIMSVIPILNAIIAGNKILIKPSKRNIVFFKMIWRGICENHIQIIEDISDFESKPFDNYLNLVTAVYFYGSDKVARKLYKMCAKKYLEFYPEVEGADVKVFYYNKKINNKKIRDDVIKTLTQSYSHNGQICQRVQGVFVDSKNYNSYLKFLKEEFTNLCLNKNSKSNSLLEFKIPPINYKNLKNKIKNSDCEEFLKGKKFPLLVINPSDSSTLIKNAYFLPIMWIKKIKNTTHLISLLNDRNFFLGINLYCDNKLSNQIINNTNFSRYTVNRHHINTNKDTGWGGNHPTSFGGYEDWISKFSNPYVIIR